MQYNLCAVSAPTDCAAAKATVNVVTKRALVANPDSGMADSGVASLPIQDVVTNDSINGGKVMLGVAGNAKIQVY